MCGLLVASRAVRYWRWTSYVFTSTVDLDPLVVCEAPSPTTLTSPPPQPMQSNSAREHAKSRDSELCFSFRASCDSTRVAAHPPTRWDAQSLDLLIIN